MAVTTGEILDHKPGETFVGQDGNTYQVDSYGTGASQIAKAPTVQTSVPSTPTLQLGGGGSGSGSGDLLSTAVAQRAQLVAEQNSPGTSADTKANIAARIEKLDTQIRLLQPKPEIASPSSSVVGPPGPDGKPTFSQAPAAPAAPARNDSPAETTAAGAAATSAGAAASNAQTNALNAQVAAWDAKLKAGQATQQEAQAAISNWIKINIETPNSIRAEANTERTGTLDAVTKLLPYLHTDSFLQKISQDNQAVASGSRNVSSYNPSDFQIPMDRVMQALDGISPTATAILHQPLGGGGTQIPTTPFPAGAAGVATNPAPSAPAGAPDAGGVASLDMTNPATRAAVQAALAKYNPQGVQTPPT